jgi:cell division septal protein FtsQ
MSPAAKAKPRRRSGGQARRPGRPVRRRLARRLPRRGRVAAMLLLLAVAGGTTWLVHGPWLRIVEVAHAGERYTPPAELEAVLAGYVTRPLLAVDSGELEARLRQLPAVADVRIRASLPGRLAVEIVEKQAAATWLTPSARLVVAADGTVIASLPRGDALADDLAPLPAVEDERAASVRLVVGSRIPAAELAAAQRLLELDPRQLGSRNPGFGVLVHEEYGFILLAERPEWRAAMGFYQAAPGETESTAVARLEAQVTALRTLFAERGEGSVGWVDARNPGKVYWAP